MSNTPRQRQKKVRRLRGECLIEGFPTGVGSAIPLDGLRLRLDLRLEPASAAETELSPLTEPVPLPGRGFTERIVQRALGVPGAYQRWAVLSGVGTLVVTLALWFFGAPLQPELDGSTDAGSPVSAAGASAAEATSLSAAPDSSSAGMAASSPNAVAPTEVVGTPSATNRTASAQTAPASPIAPRASIVSGAPTTAARPASVVDPARPRTVRPALPTATAVVETAALAKPRLAAQKQMAPRSVEADLLDLFSDTK